MKKRIIWVSFILLVCCFVISILFKKTNNPLIQTFSIQEWFRFPSSVNTDSLSHKMKVAAVALPVNSDKERCLTNILSISKEIIEKEPDTNLIVFGESSLGLYFDEKNKKAYQINISEAIPGPATKKIGEIAKLLKIYIAIGLIEKAEDLLFNSMIVIDPNGNIIAKHRKQFLHQYDEENGIALGVDQVDICYVNGFKMGLAICADANKKTLIKEYRKNEVDVLLFSVTSNLPWILRQTDYWPIATEYSAWIIGANRYGKENNENYSGYIFIADPNGVIHKKQNGQSGYITSVIGK